jgi:hypothetical protein
MALAVPLRSATIFARHWKTSIFNGKGVVFWCSFAGKKAGEKPMKENLEKLKLLSRNLRDGKQYPFCQRETLEIAVYDLEEEQL